MSTMNGFCVSDFSCSRNSDCSSSPGLKCQHRRCVKRAGGECSKHQQCPELQVYVDQ